jgi:phosphonopyruvate decarboxylase
MISMEQYGKKLESLGFNFFSGVPCSFLKPMINYAINKKQFYMASNEGDAVAIAAGAYLGGRKSVFLCQNSGLTNAVSPLTSLNYTFEIPVLGFVSLRGEQGLKDEPQHELMGTITDKMLEVMQIHYEIMADNAEEAFKQLERANEIIEQGKSFFFIVKKDTFGSMKLNEQVVIKNNTSNIVKSTSTQDHFKRLDVLNVLKETSTKDTLLLATTGVTGRELFELEDSDSQFYMVGSMGCISSLGLGLAIAQPGKNIIVIDGDGSLLMRMGSLTSNAYYNPSNMYHLLLDNGLHESTGGQKTVSSNIDFMKIAEGANYPNVVDIKTLEELKNSIEAWTAKKELTFAYCKTEKGIKENLGRPTVTPIQVRERFMKYINN